MIGIYMDLRDGKERRKKNEADGNFSLWYINPLKFLFVVK